MTSQPYIDQVTLIVRRTLFLARGINIATFAKIFGRITQSIVSPRQTAIWIYARKENHRCHACSKNVDGKVQGRSKRATLCIRGPREGLRQGSTGRAVVLYEKIRNINRNQTA